MLKVDRLNTYYGDVQVLFDVSLEVGPGEMVALVGANGAGKSTTVSAVSGLMDRISGTIEFMGQEIQSLPAHQIVERGLIHVPERRRLFPFLTVLENLEMGAFTPRARTKKTESLEQVFALLPVLEERLDQLAGTLSGGEQQMCAIGRGLMACPSLLMLDEPTEGLAPIYVERIFQTIRHLQDKGSTILIIEQNVTHALKMADRGYVLENGRIVLQGPGRDLLGDERLRRAYLGIVV